MSIKEHLVDVESNVGVITLISTERKNRPADLRRPYEYVLTIKQAKKLYEELNALLEPLDRTMFQMAGVSKKALSKGVRLNLFILGYVPGLLGPDDDRTGCTRKQWADVCKSVQTLLIKYLGKDARIYADRHSAKDKFQARLETYIAYKELL